MHGVVSTCYTIPAKPCSLIEKNSENAPEENTITTNPKPNPNQKTHNPMGIYKSSWRKQLSFVPISRIILS